MIPPGSPSPLFLQIHLLRHRYHFSSRYRSILLWNILMTSYQQEQLLEGYISYDTHLLKIHYTSSSNGDFPLVAVNGGLIGVSNQSFQGAIPMAWTLSITQYTFSSRGTMGPFSSLTHDYYYSNRHNSYDSGSPPHSAFISIFQSANNKVFFSQEVVTL